MQLVASLSSPCSLVVDVSFWATSLLGVAVRRVFCGCFFFPLLVMLPSEIPKLPTDLPVRGFPTVWNLFLLYHSLPRMGLCLSFISHILSYLLLKKTGCLSGCLWCPLPAFRSYFVEVSQHSNDLLMNLWGRKWSPQPIPPSSWDHPLVGPICMTRLLP